MSSKQRDELQAYLENGYELIPHQTGTKYGYTNWPTIAYDSKAVADDACREGYSVGCRLRHTDLVIDVDVGPGKGGQKSFDNLCLELGLDPTQWPRVETGSGGSHYYLHKPPDIRIKQTLRDYPGIDFKTAVGQVVAAGSTHIRTGKPYFWDGIDHPPLADAPQAPESLLALLRKEVKDIIPTGAGQATPKQIEEALAGLDVTAFRDHETWKQLMMACHHASGGDARSEFIEWCVGDPDYADHGEEIGRRWDSLHAKASEAITYRTLNQFLHKAGRPNLQIHGDASGDFEAVEDAKLEPMKWDITQLSSMLNYAEAAMLAGGVPLYRVDSRLVYPVRLDRDDDPVEDVRRKAGALNIWDVSPLRLREFMIQHAPFYTIKSPGPQPLGAMSEEVRKAFAPSPQFAQHYLARPDAWKLDSLVGVIEAPTLRRDGSLLIEPGFDKASGLLLDTDGATFPPINDQPTRDDALAALALLKTLFVGFPFLKNTNGESASLSVMLSAVLTALVRRTLHSSPCHGTSAPTMGTGKTLSQNVVSLVATGRLATAMSQGASEEEDEKRLFSVLLRNDLIVLIDNVRRPIQFDGLCTVLTEPTWQSRFLGESRNVTVRTNALILATGNNLTFAGDMTTRALLARMDAGVERPEERSFNVDLKTEIPKRRGKLVAAGLTVLRAFVVAGRPGLDTFKPFGRFEDWSNLVRGALIWLGEPDPCLTRNSIVTADPERDAAMVLFREMHAADGGWRTAGEWMKLSEKMLTERSDDDGLYNAIQDVARGSVKSFARYLLSQERKIISGLCLRTMKDRKRRQTMYQVVLIQKAGIGRESRIISNH